MTAEQTTSTDDRRPPRGLGDEMLSLQEACALLRVPEGTLRYWRHLGAGPHSFKVGRHVRYWRTDLVLWLSDQTNASRPDIPAPYPQIPEQRDGGSRLQEGR